MYLCVYQYINLSVPVECPDAESLHGPIKQLISPEIHL
jgi:hypothetical protein